MLLPLGVVLGLLSCTGDEPTYRIGVSQCSGGEWRDLQNKEMLVESTFYDNVELDFRTAYDDDSLQILDIEFFIARMVDMIVVSPNTIDALNPVLGKAVKAGITVVLFDRRVSFDNYTAFVGANNYDIGFQAGNYLGAALNGYGYVLELENNMSSAPFRERHDGFMKALDAYPGIKVSSHEMRPTEELMKIFVDSLFSAGRGVDGIYSHVDRNFNQIDDVVGRHGLGQDLVTVGIDAMPFPNGGIDRVLEHKQTATFVYPTGGDRIIQVAMDILEGRPFERENELQTYVIDDHNVRLVRAQTDELMKLNYKLERLYDQTDNYLNQIHQGKLRLFVVITIAALLAFLLFVLCYAYWMRNRLNRRLMKQNEKILQQKDKMCEQRDQILAMSRQVEEATNAKLVFFTNVSHDFRTPLTLISGPLSQLRKISNWDKSGEMLYNIVQKNIGVLMRLVNQIIDFRKFENGKMTLNVRHADLDKLVGEWGNAFYALADERRVNFSVEIAPNADFNIDVDQEKIERVFYNIVYNAFKFTPPDGAITVRLSEVPGEHAKVQLVIADTGAGMTKENAARIFDRFYKVDSHDSGSGIGLNLAKAFVELHEGTVTVNSEVGKGTSFVVELPKRQMSNHHDDNLTHQGDATLNNEEKETLEKLESENNLFDLCEEGSADNAEKELVLVIDDNADIREFVKHLLSDSYRVLTANNGDQGLDMAVRHVPDAIVCDIMMPVMDGLEFCKRIKEDMTTSHIPVMLLTACSLDEQRVSGYESGADSYISKPFTPELLLSRIRNLIDNRRRIKPNFVDVRTAHDKVKDPDLAFVRKFKDYIESNLGDSSLSMDSLGDEMGMSRVQIYRKVKSLLGVTPSDMIKEARMKKAKTMLANDKCSISDVAYGVGFSSPSYFTKCYKDFFGTLPRGEDAR